MKLFDQFPHIAGEAVNLRKIVDNDADDLFALYSSEEVYAYIPGEARRNKPAVANMIWHFERDFQKGKEIFLGITLRDNPGKIVGVAEIFDYDAKVNMATIGYRLHPAYWGQGIATNAVRTMLPYLFGIVGINRIQAFVMPENIASQRVLEKCGFSREGLLRQSQYWKGRGVVDLLLFSCLREEFDAS